MSIPVVLAGDLSPEIVFHSGMPVVMVGWEHCIGDSLLFNEDIARMRALNTPFADFTLDCNRAALKACREWLGLAGLSLPDPVCMAVALDRSIGAQIERKYVDVETTSDLTRGETVVDRFSVLNKEPNIEVCFAVDSDRFKNLLFDLVK